MEEKGEEEKTKMINPLTLNYFNQNLALRIYVFGFISILPTLLYVAFKRLEDNGSGGGFIGYYLVKLLRKLR